MSQLVRMDQTGHTVLAEWTREDSDSVERAAVRLRQELADGHFAVVSHGEGRAELIRELPLDASLVILRRPIAGG